MTDPIQASPDALFALAAKAEKDGDDETAAKRYGEAVAAAPDLFQARHNLAVVLTRLGRFDEAIATATAARDLAPDHPVVRFTLAVALERAGAVDDAIAEYGRAQSLRPNYIDAASNLGRLLSATGEPSAAAAVLEPAVRRRPDHAAARVNLGNAYLELGLPDAAAEQFTGALVSQPDLVAAQNSLAVADSLLGRTDAAIDGFRAAIEMQPDNAEAHENLALELLRKGRFRDGWKEYEWRWRNPSNAIVKRTFPAPLWDGAPLDGKSILILAEQAYGDALQYVRFVPMVANAGGRVILECRPGLARLFATARGVETIIEPGAEPPDDIELCVPMMSLPHLLGTTAKTIPAEVPYLSVPDGVDGGTIPTSPSGDSFDVGITWSGTPRFAGDAYRDRSCPPNLSARLAEIGNVRLVSLQIDAGPEDLAAAGTVSNPLSGDFDFAQTAATLRHLDLVVSVDTAVGHLAGALAKPCWLLLPFAAAHQWMTERDDSPWYPQHRLFRQSKPGDWGQVFSRVAEQLRAVAAG